MEKSRSIVSNLIWKFCERLLAQLVTLVVSLVVARILNPDDYGLVAILLVFVSIADIFVTESFGSALIQKRDSDDLDFSSVFYFNVVFSVFIYVGIFVAAPHFESFYGAQYSSLSSALRILALRIPITAINNVQQAYASKRMIFKKFFFATLFSSIISGCVGISMAVVGFGFWALIAQYLSSAIVNSVVLWLTVKWRPKRCFSFSRLIPLLSYSWKIMVAGLIDAVYNNLRSLVIGKRYTSSDLAFYNRGQQFPSLIIENVGSAISSVIFPALSQVQDDVTKTHYLIKRSIEASGYCIVSLVVLMGIVAEPLVRIVLTEKWLFCVPFLQAFCFMYAFQPFARLNQQVIKALGRSDILLAMEVVQKVSGLLVLLITYDNGPMAICLGCVLCSVLHYVLYVVVGGHCAGYSALWQLKDVASSIFLSIISGIAAVMIGFFRFNCITTLCLQLIVFCSVYIGVSLITKNKTLSWLIGRFRHQKK